MGAPARALAGVFTLGASELAREGLGALTKTPEIPPEATVPPPTPEEEAVQEAGAEQRRRRQRGRTFRSTILRQDILGGQADQGLQTTLGS